MDSGDRPETGLPAQRSATLESRQHLGLLSRLSSADGRRLDSRRVSLGISATIAQLRRQAQANGESIPVGIWAADPDGRMQYLSESFLQMAGQTTEQAQGNGWMGALAPETAEQTRRDWSTAVDTKTPWSHELVVLDTDGRRRTVLSRGFPVRDESGEVTSAATRRVPARRCQLAPGRWPDQWPARVPWTRGSGSRPEEGAASAAERMSLLESVAARLG